VQPSDIQQQAQQTAQQQQVIQPQQQGVQQVVQLQAYDQAQMMSPQLPLQATPAMPQVPLQVAPPQPAMMHPQQSPVVAAVAAPAHIHNVPGTPLGTKGVKSSLLKKVYSVVERSYC